MSIELIFYCMGSDGGVTGVTVAFNAIGSAFESSHNQYLWNINLLLNVVWRKDGNKEKGRLTMGQSQPLFGYFRLFNSNNVSYKASMLTVWPDGTIYWTLGNFIKPLATIILLKSPRFLGNFCEGVKIYFSSEIIFEQLL